MSRLKSVMNFTLKYKDVLSPPPLFLCFLSCSFLFSLTPSVSSLCLFSLSLSLLLVLSCSDSHSCSYIFQLARTPQHLGPAWSVCSSACTSQATFSPDWVSGSKIYGTALSAVRSLSTASAAQPSHKSMPVTTQKTSRSIQTPISKAISGVAWVPDCASKPQVPVIGSCWDQIHSKVSISGTAHPLVPIFRSHCVSRVPSLEMGSWSFFHTLGMRPKR